MILYGLSGVTGWVLFVGLMITNGAVAARWLIVRRARRLGDATTNSLHLEAARFGRAGALVLVLGLGLFFLRQLIEFRDPFSPWLDEAELLMSTSWGRNWAAAAVGSILALVTFHLACRRPAGWWLATPLVLGLGAFPALTGHASATERFTTLFVLADTMHVWAAGGWIGGLGAVLWLDRSARSSMPDTGLLPVLVAGFSPVAVGSVATLALTGGLASWEHLPSVSALLTTAWSQLLLAKLLAVVVVLALGARNFRVLTPRLGTEEGNDGLRRSALLELAVAQGVLILTALLVRTSPM